VDDDPDPCASLSGILPDLGYGVSVRHGRAGTVSAHGQLRPSVVGVFVTAFAASSVTDEAKAVGVRAILPKPVDFEELLPLVEEIVGSAA